MEKFTDSPYFILKEYFDGHTIGYEPADGAHIRGPYTCITTEGGYWTRLYIKHEYDETEGDNSFTGFIEYKFRVNETPYVNNNFGFSVPEVGAIVTPEALGVNNIRSGSDVYFRKDSHFHDWLIKNVDTYGEFVNTECMFLYFGKIYDNGNNTYKIIYNGMKDFVIEALPVVNRTDRLKVLLELFFDKLYMEVHNKIKKLNTLLDPWEVDERYLDYLSSLHSMVVDPYADETSKREWVDNLIYYLKRKGTYTAIYVFWKIYLKNTLNKVNIYERWHDPLSKIVGDNPLPYFDDILHEHTYDANLTDNIRIQDYRIIEQTTEDNVWTVNHNLNTENLIVRCYDENGEYIDYESLKSIYEEDPITRLRKSDTMVIHFTKPYKGHVFLSYGGGASYDYYNKFRKLPEYRFVQENAATWYIRHYENTRLLVVQFYNTDGERIIPKRIYSKDVNNHVIYFHRPVSGEIYIKVPDYDNTYVSSGTWSVIHNGGQKYPIVQFLDTSYNVISPSACVATDSNTLTATWHSDTAGEAMVINIIDYLHTQGTGSSTWTVDHNLGTYRLYCEVYDESDKIISPETITHGTNTSILTFDSSVSGHASFVISDENPDFDGAVLSPHYRVEMDLSSDPLDNDYIFPKRISDFLLYNWELFRPVTKYAHYSILISPYLDNTGGIYTRLYPLTKNYTASLRSKYCLPTSGYIDYPDSKVYTQKEVSKVWTFVNEFRCEFLFIQCWDSDDALLNPKTIDITENTLTITFSTNVKGYLCVGKITGSEGCYFKSFSNLHEELYIYHNLSNFNIMSQYSKSTHTHMMPSGVQIDINPEFIKSWNKSEGIALIAPGEYTHTQSVPASAWDITHSFNKKEIFISIYDENGYEIRPHSVQLNDVDTCTVTFLDEITGKAILKSTRVDEDFVTFFDNIDDTYTWKLGNGGSNTYDPSSTDNLDSVVVSGTGGITGSYDDNYYYIDFSRLSGEYYISEIGIFATDGDLKLYSYCDPIYKANNVEFRVRYRIKKDLVQINKTSIY